VWKPVSKLEYQPLNPKGQVIVIACPMLKRDDEIKERWKERAVAILNDSSKYLRDVVRDILANPQVRAIVFDGAVCCRDAYDAFWLGKDQPAWRIEKEHIDLVRQFVDLFDDDCMWQESMQPFWPARIMYLEDKCD
jgi:hypothetical protein